MESGYSRPKSLERPSAEEVKETEKIKLAFLAEHFHMPISEYKKLTDYQIAEVYFYPRDKYGQLKMDRITSLRSKRESMPQRVETGTPQEIALRKLGYLQSVLGNNPGVLASIEAARKKIIEKGKVV